MKKVEEKDMQEVSVWKELRLGIRLIYVGLAALTYAGFANLVVPNMTLMMAGIMLILSLVNEYVLVRHLVNGAKSPRSKPIIVLVFMLLGIAISMYALYVVTYYPWVEPVETSVRHYILWSVAYAYGISFFIAAAVVRRSLTTHVY